MRSGARGTGAAFPQSTKYSAQTYADFAEEKGILFDLWCCTCKVVPQKSFFHKPKISPAARVPALPPKIKGEKLRFSVMNQTI